MLPYANRYILISFLLCLIVSPLHAGDDLVFEPRKLKGETLGVRVLHKPKPIVSPFTPINWIVITIPEGLLALIDWIPSFLKWIHPLSYLTECIAPFCSANRLENPHYRQQAEDITVKHAVQDFSQQDALKIVMFAESGLYQSLVLTQKLVSQKKWKKIEIHIISPALYLIAQQDKDVEDPRVKTFRDQKARATHQFLNWFTWQDCDIELQIYNRAYDFLRLEFDGRLASGHKEVDMLVALDWLDDGLMIHDGIFHRHALMLALPPGSISMSLIGTRQEAIISVLQRTGVASPFQSMDDGWLTKYEAGELCSNRDEFRDRYFKAMNILFVEKLFQPERYRDESELGELTFEENNPEQTAITVSGILDEIAGNMGVIDPVWISSFPTSVIAALISLQIFKPQNFEPAARP